MSTTLALISQHPITTGLIVLAFMAALGRLWNPRRADAMAEDLQEYCYQSKYGCTHYAYGETPRPTVLARIVARTRHEAISWLWLPTAPVWIPALHAMRVGRRIKAILEEKTVRLFITLGGIIVFLGMLILFILNTGIPLLELVLFR